MRILQITLIKLLAVFALVGGIAVVVVWGDPTLLAKVLPFVKAAVWPKFGLVLGILAVILGLAGLLPLLGSKRKKTISFQGTHGEVSIELDSVEATLSRVVGKMPEVKKISVTVNPSEDNRQAQVFANVLMYKGAETAGAREIANRISEYLADTAVNILGVEDITKINLNIRGIIIDAVKPRAASGAVLAEPHSGRLAEPAHESIPKNVTFQEEPAALLAPAHDPFADAQEAVPAVAPEAEAAGSTSFGALQHDFPQETEDRTDATQEEK